MNPILKLALAILLLIVLSGFIPLYQPVYLYHCHYNLLTSTHSCKNDSQGRYAWKPGWLVRVLNNNPRPVFSGPDDVWVIP